MGRTLGWVVRILGWVVRMLGLVGSMLGLVMRMLGYVGRALGLVVREKSSSVGPNISSHSRSWWTLSTNFFSILKKVLKESPSH
jgi:hypothetical protein